MLPLLLMPPVKVSTPETAMPGWAAVMLPLLVMPPVKVEMLTQLQGVPTTMPAPPDWIVPLLLMPPANVDTLLTTIALLLAVVVIVPVLTIPLVTTEFDCTKIPMP